MVSKDVIDLWRIAECQHAPALVHEGRPEDNAAFRYRALPIPDSIKGLKPASIR